MTTFKATFEEIGPLFIIPSGHTATDLKIFHNDDVVVGDQSLEGKGQTGSSFLTIEVNFGR